MKALSIFALITSAVPVITTPGPVSGFHVLAFLFSAVFFAGANFGD